MQKQDRRQRAKPPGETWYVYLLRCADGSLYTGIAKDVSRRLEKHNAGKASRYTRSRRPVRLIYQEDRPNQSSALKREATIKAMTRQGKLALIRLSRYTPAFRPAWAAASARLPEASREEECRKKVEAEMRAAASIPVTVIVVIAITTATPRSS